MVQIRRGVFETNSSSTHSITAMKKVPREPSDLVIGDDGYIHAKLGGYGWEFRTLATQEEKLSYLLTMAWEKSTEKDYYYRDPERCERAISRFMESDEYIRISKKIAEYTGCYGILLDNTAEDDAYIDHQSEENYLNISNFLYTNNTTILDFVFSPGVTVRTGNDNEPDPDDKLLIGHSFNEWWDF